MAASDRVTSVTNFAIEDGWQRVHVTYTPTTTGTYRMAAIQENAYLYGYFNDFQLKKGEAASNVNLLQNGWFRSINDPQEWTDTNLYFYAVIFRRTRKSPGTSFTMLRGRGEVDTDWSFLQDIHV